MGEQEHIIETFSEMATRYEQLMNSELNRFWGINYDGFITEVLAGISLNKSNTILDIATGTAFIPRKIIADKNCQAKIIGLDLTYQMLLEGKRLIKKMNRNNWVGLTCATALKMPFRSNTFDIGICCLATHHMQVDTLLAEIFQVLTPGGTVYIGDVGGSSRWKIGFVRGLIKIFAFIYFLFTENYSRAKAESSAVANVITSREWRELFVKNGFVDINIREVSSTKFWAPNPVIIKAKK